MSYYWEEHKKFYWKGRYVWYAPRNETFWNEYWNGKITPKLYHMARTIALEQSLLGKVFLRYLPLEGICLEAGCGPGFWVEALRTRGYAIEGIELEQEVVEKAQSIVSDLPICVGDVKRIDRPDEFYSGYISLGVVEHDFNGPEAFLQEAYRVLKPGGVLIVSVPAVGFSRMCKAKAGLIPKKEHLDMFLHDGGEFEFFQYGFSMREMADIMQRLGFYPIEFMYDGVNRLLIEESRTYRSLTHFPKVFRILSRLSTQILRQKDGHMLVIVAGKLK